MDVRENDGGGRRTGLVKASVADALSLAFLLDDRLHPSSGPTDTIWARKGQIDPFEADSLSCNGCESIRPDWHACPTIINYMFHETRCIILGAKVRSAQAMKLGSHHVAALGGSYQHINTAPTSWWRTPVPVPRCPDRRSMAGRSPIVTTRKRRSLLPQAV